MRWFWSLLAVLCGVCGAHATVLPVPGQDCQSAILAAERRHGLPPGLLSAIALVESGRRNEAGAPTPWPWTINAEGEGRFFAEKAAAVAAVRQLQQEGVASIDVGCLQVNLMHHPRAFASLEQAFEPAANADYAARYLRDLYAGVGNWE